MKRSLEWEKFERRQTARGFKVTDGYWRYDKRRCYHLYPSMYFDRTRESRMRLKRRMREFRNDPRRCKERVKSQFGNFVFICSKLNCPDHPPLIEVSNS